MHRFYRPDASDASPPTALTDRDAHHARRVLRARPGDSVRILNGKGREWICHLTSITDSEVLLANDEVIVHPPPPAQITLVQALPKGRIFDDIVQKTTELGVAHIVPVISSRVVQRPNPSQYARRLGKWNLTAAEALKQCGTPWLPTIDSPVPLHDWINHRQPCTIDLVASLLPDAQSIRSQFESVPSSKTPPSLSVCVGPEGDFSGEEYAALHQSGFRPVRLPGHVLRVETAAITAVALLHYEASLRWANT